MFRRELVLRAPSVDFWGYKKCGLPAAVLTKGTKSLVEGTRTVRGKMVRAPILDQDTLMIMGKMGGYQAECPNSDALTAGTEGVAELTTKEKVVITRQNLGTWSTQVVLQPGDYDDVTSLGLTDDQLSCLSIYASAIILSTEYGNVSGKTCLVLGSNTPVGAVLSNVLTSAGAKVTAVPGTRVLMLHQTFPRHHSSSMESVERFFVRRRIRLLKIVPLSVGPTYRGNKWMLLGQERL
eukprot:TRINITY_DN6255_c1_g1_i1.p1 TRINITY_DN6255_c1_g1~~TRINITY_DN6255_c1_g1_i1.p1  ORF type:complete len:250 (+),score=18.94 TRINITY_DN6255_c1_g1_i1:42-752(+)